MKEFGGSPLADLSKGAVEAFLTAASNRLAPESVRDLRAGLRGLLSIAGDWERIKAGSNPAAGRLRLPPRISVHEKRYPTPDELRSFGAVWISPTRRS